MTTIVTRITNPTGGTAKGTPLTSVEIDANFNNLNDNKVEITDAVSTNTANKVVRRDASGNFSAGAITLSTALTLLNGGTGATTTSGARANLGLAIGTDVQAWDSDLDAYAALTTTGVIQRTGTGTVTASNSIQITSLGVGTAASGTTGQIRATDTIVAFYSDERLKKDIVTIPDALEKVLSLRGVTYFSNEIAESYGYTSKERMVGVLAQDVQKVLPEAVKPAPFDILQLNEGIEISRSGENYMTVQYEKLVPLLIEAIKTLNKEIKELKDKGVN
jgi:hypothetical protein